MADGVTIDWSQLRQPDPLGDYQNAFAAGRAVAASRINTGGNPGFSGQPAAAEAAEPQPASIQDHIASMSGDQRLAAGRAQEQFAAILNGLKLQTTDPAERLAMARHLAGLHPEFGIDPNTITTDDVSDQGLARHVATALGLKGQLEDANARQQAGGVAPWGPVQGAATSYSSPSHALSDDDLIAALRTHGLGGIAPSIRTPALQPSSGFHPHTLSDQDLKSILEF
jgi:hypothetical protein